MRDGSDAVSDWPLLNALLSTAGGASWVSFHHGGGVGMGYSHHEARGRGVRVRDPLREGKRPRPPDAVVNGADAIWTNARLATMAAGPDYGAIEDGAIAVSGGRITWVGARAEVPSTVRTSSTREHDATRAVEYARSDRLSHAPRLVYAGSRAGEFEMRLNGASYEEIARAGGGIVSTVAAARAASKEELIESAARRLAGAHGAKV